MRCFHNTSNLELIDPTQTDSKYDFKCFHVAFRSIVVRRLFIRYYSIEAVELHHIMNSILQQLHK